MRVTVFLLFYFLANPSRLTYIIGQISEVAVPLSVFRGRTTKDFGKMLSKMFDILKANLISGFINIRFIANQQLRGAAHPNVTDKFIGRFT